MQARRAALLPAHVTAPAAAESLPRYRRRASALPASASTRVSILLPSRPCLQRFIAPLHSIRALAVAISVAAPCSLADALCLALA